MTETLRRIIDILQPIADLDWHGKWRIQKVIEMCSNKDFNVAAESWKGGGHLGNTTETPE